MACRHLEAPDRFRAIQTYRAAMAIMAQQRQFIHRVYNNGVLSDAEKLLMEEVLTSLVISVCFNTQHCEFCHLLP